MAQLPNFNNDPERIRSLSKSLTTRRDVADLLCVPLQYITAILFRDGVNMYYRSWTVSKRRGGQRVIHAPQGGLYILQHRLHQVLQVWYQPRPSAHGFIRKRSIVTNARPHIGKRFILNVDLQDFFPSMNFGRVRGVLMAPPFNVGEKAATLIAQIACFEDSLPIGGPSSPDLSNMICMRLDGELMRLARQHGCFYTRYADDLTFSTNRREFPEALFRPGPIDKRGPGEALVAAIEGNGFRINPRKTRLLTRNDQQSVTGLVTNVHLNVDRRFVRLIRAMIHSIEALGLTGAQSKYAQTLKPAERFSGAPVPRVEQVIRGRISYLSMVRGSSDPLVRKLRTQLDNVLNGRPRNQGVVMGTIQGESATLRILHLSDFHFSVDTTWDSGAVLQELSQALDEVAPIDLVVVSGDIAFSGSQAEYDLAEKFFLESFLPALAIAPSSILFVPGNHDVDRGSVTGMSRAMREAIRSDGDPDRLLAETLKDSKQLEVFMTPFDAYRRFEQTFVGEERPLPWWREEVPTAAGNVLIAGLSSPLVSIDDNDKGRLLLGQPQVNGALTATGTINIAVLHHPFDYFRDEDRPARRKVEEWADLILHGHLHEEEYIHGVSSGTGVTILAAGACYQGSRFAHGFQVLELDLARRTVTVERYRRDAGRPGWYRSRDAAGDGSDTGIQTFNLPVR